MSDDVIDDVDIDSDRDPPPPRAPRPPPAKPTAIAGDRVISPIAGSLGLGRGGKGLALAGLVAGCGVFFIATGSHPHAHKPPAGDVEPARQLVDFASVAAHEPQDSSMNGARTPTPVGGAAGGPIEPGAPELAGADAFRPQEAQSGSEITPVAGQGAGIAAAQGQAADPLAAKAAASQAALASIRAAPMIAYSGPNAASPKAEGGEAGGSEFPGASSLHSGAAGAASAESELDGLRRGSAIGLVRARRLPDRNFLLVAGALIPCVLETALDSSAPGFVTCRIPRDVYSDNGAVVLLEKGARVLGEYRSGFQQGRARLFVIWDRITTPGGVAVDVASPASDALGRAGFNGHVDTHFWTRFGGALLLTTVSGALSAAATADARVAAVGPPANEAASVALQNSISIPPTLTKAQGSEVALFVSRDLDFSGVYGLKPR